MFSLAWGTVVTLLHLIGHSWWRMICAMHIVAGSSDYLEWLDGEVQAGEQRETRKLK